MNATKDRPDVRRPETRRAATRLSAGGALVLMLALSSAAAAPLPASEPGPDDGPKITLFRGRSTTLTAPWSVKGASLTNPDVANVDVLTPQLLLVSGVGAGMTDLIFWSESGQTREVRIEVLIDVDRLSAKLDVMFPGADLALEQADGAIVVTGHLGHAEDSRQLRDYLDIYDIPYMDRTTLPGIQQVEVQVRLAEVSRKGVRALGFNFFKTGQHLILGNTVGSSTGGPINPISIGPPGGATALGNTPFTFTAPQAVASSTSFFAAFPGSDLQLFVQALAENEYLRILAEPTLVALSGEEASFLAGGEFPIPVVQGGSLSGASITIEYKEFGIKLKFRPIVLGEGMIRLKVTTEVSDLTDIGSVELQGFNIPALVQREAETTLELGSGQSFAMAGLLNETTNAATARIPGLGDLPILGPLFRSVRYRSGETELVVMVTASLVEPNSKTSYPQLPGEEHEAPSDWELYALGRIEGRTATPTPPPGAAWLREIGLARLRGPGAWATHDQPMAVSNAQPDFDAIASLGWSPAAVPRRWGPVPVAAEHVEGADGGAGPDGHDAAEGDDPASDVAAGDASADDSAASGDEGTAGQDGETDPDQEDGEG